MKKLEREIERLLDSNLHYQNDLKKDASMIATYISERDKRIKEKILKLVCQKICNNKCVTEDEDDLTGEMEVTKQGCEVGICFDKIFTEEK